MSTLQNVLVIGAAGKTGGSVVDGLLDFGKFVCLCYVNKIFMT